MFAKGSLFVALLLWSTLAWTASDYADPDGFYRLDVPEGWTLTSQANGISLTRGAAYASLIRMQGRGTPASLREFFAGRIGSQWRQFDGASAGDAGFGGRSGVFGWYTGINPRGVEAVLKIVTTTDNEFGYAMLISAPRQEFGAVKGDLERIEAGFRLLPR